MADYFTVESARDQILRIGHVEKEFAPQSFPDDWQFCPCLLETKGLCRNSQCHITLPIGLNEPHLGQFPIEIIYVKNKGGFIRTDNARLKRLIEDRVIDAPDIVNF